MMVLELLAGNLGLPLGLPLFTAVYFAVAFGTAYGLAAAGGAGLLLDVIYARNYFFTALINIAIVYLSAKCACRLQRKMPVSPLSAGFLCGLLINFNNNITSWLNGNELPGPDLWSMVIFQVSGGSLLLLAIVPLFDAVNFRSRMPRFVDSDSTRRRVIK